MTFPTSHPLLCGWSLPHRLRHVCSCVCVLPGGHQGRHACTAEETPEERNKRTISCSICGVTPVEVPGFDRMCWACFEAAKDRRRPVDGGKR